MAIKKKVDRYLAAAVQTAYPDSLDRGMVNRTIERNLDLVEQVMLGYNSFGFPVKLIVFPEYMQGAAYSTLDDYIKNDILLTIPGNETARFIESARKHNIYICPGSWLEKDPKYPNHIFNTAIIVGPEGIVLKYRKINPWECGEFLVTSPHSIRDYDFTENAAFPVAETPIGKLGVAICYDWIFPEVTRELTMKGAEVLIRPSAYMYPWGADWDTVVCKVRSLENVAYCINVNQGSTLKESLPYSFPGGSCIIDYEGRIVSQVNRSGQHIIVGPISLDALREWRANTYQHAMPAQIRSEVYTYLKKQWLPKGDLTKDESPTLEKSMNRIDEGRKRIWGEILEEHQRK